MHYAETLHSDFSGHIDPRSRLHAIAGGFRFLEGPVWDTASHRLVFSDIKGNALYSYSPRDGVKIYRDNSYLANGNALDLDGSLLTCEHGTSRISRTDRKGVYTVLVDSYRGRALNSPNDIVVKRDGAVYFTDPASGRSPGFGIPRPQELPYQGVYRFDRLSSALTLLADDFPFPNGLCFSADERLLYVNDTSRQHIRCFDVDDEGMIGNGRLFAELIQDLPVGKADGMKIDASGLLFCTGPGGIQIFNSKGSCVGRIFIPEQAANFTWGGSDLQTLYITATTTLYSIRMEVPGPGSVGTAISPA